MFFRDPLDPCCTHQAIMQTRLVVSAIRLKKPDQRNRRCTSKQWMFIPETTQLRMKRATNLVFLARATVCGKRSFITEAKVQEILLVILRRFRRAPGEPRAAPSFTPSSSRSTKRPAKRRRFADTPFLERSGIVQAIKFEAPHEHISNR